MLAPCPYGHGSRIEILDAPAREAALTSIGKRSVAAGSAAIWLAASCVPSAPLRSTISSVGPQESSSSTLALCLGFCSFVATSAGSEAPAMPSQHNRTLLGLGHSCAVLGEPAPVANWLGMLAIQAGRLLAILRDFIVSSNDFCGEGVPILGVSSGARCGKLQHCNAALGQNCYRRTRDKATARRKYGLIYKRKRDKIWILGCRISEPANEHLDSEQLVLATRYNDKCQTQER